MCPYFSTVGMSIENALEKYHGGELKYTFVYPGELKFDSNNASLLSGCYRHHLKGCSAGIFSPYLSYSLKFEFLVSIWS